ncbi:MAG TPA: selenoneine biosynthesis selenosugar synthase SenB [Fimbriimonadales bacterium]|nr:selenoneine biosynthesis selenosugar synthase SenB [Fimbriimonadales bacterium]
MRILIVTPAPKGSRHGNRVTATRWANILRELGHSVSVTNQYANNRCDLLIALHARKSYPAIREYKIKYPDKPLIVALTGTDVYQDLSSSEEAKHSLEYADRIVTLQPLAKKALTPEIEKKAIAIFQSAKPVLPKPREKTNVFEVCVLCHLRRVKDPLRAAYAARLLPDESKIRIIHVGKAIEEEYRGEALQEMDRNGRYRWLGEVSHRKALRILARAKLLVVSSVLEGGANVVSEAIVNDVPVISSRIEGSVGILGEDYPGYFQVGDTKKLAESMLRCEKDERFYRDLQFHCSRLRPLFTPGKERDSWKGLLDDLIQARSILAQRVRA